VVGLQLFKCESRMVFLYKSRGLELLAFYVNGIDVLTDGS